jgi:phospholipid/cholesterol/gamma-HCH transport system substrate-binding protein
VYVLTSSGGGYHVKARFISAAQLVKGNLVQVAGQPAGKVEDIQLTRSGQAEVTMRIDDRYAPLRRGTLATIRQSSLSGVANRYVDLRLAPQRAPAIPDGGIMGTDSTTTAVDLDQIFDTLDPSTRRSLAGLIRGSADQFRGKGRAMNEGLLYLNPSLAASSTLFRELNRDSRLLERFVVANSQLVTDVAERHQDLAGLVDHLATTLHAIGNRQSQLADSISQLPPFMRQANSTFVDLRSALDDLDPLVRDSKPVARKLRPFMAELRPFARDARPTLRDLSRIVSTPGADNDLIDLLGAQPPLRDVAVRTVHDDGADREGAFPASTKALDGSTPEVAFLRPYSVDLLGWFDDFSHSGIYDALGAASRVGVHGSAFALLNGQLSPVPPELRGQSFDAAAEHNQNNRCPGAAEHAADDGSNPYKPSPDFNCDPTERLPGK